MQGNSCGGRVVGGVRQLRLHRRVGAAACRALMLGVMACATGSMVPTPAWAQNLDQGLVSYYRFENDLADTAAGSHHGSALANAAPTYVSGYSGQAASFDGIDDAVRFMSMPNSVFTGDFSVSWFMRQSALGRFSLLGNRGGCTSGHYFDLRFASAGSDRVQFIVNAGIPIAGALAPPLVLDRWMHFVAVRQGTSVRVYTDGVSGMPGANAPYPDYSLNTTPFGISTSPCIAHGDGTRFFSGQMDELRVYNRALSASEAQELAQGEGITNAGTVSVTPATVGVESSFVLNARNVLPGDGEAVACQARLGFGGAILATPQPDAARNVRADIVLPASVQPGQHEIVLLCGAPAAPVPETIGHDTLTVTGPIIVTTSASSGFPGERIDFTAADIVGNSFELWADAERVFGPAATVDGAIQGVFAVPAAGPGSIQLSARGFSGRVQTSSGAVNFTRTADPGYRVRIDSAQVPATSPPETALTISGRIQVASGSPQSRTINFFYRGSDGRVIPLGSRDVVPDAQGNFSVDVEIPSASNLNGYIARGQGEVFFTFTEIDEITRAVRTITQSAGNTSSPGYIGYGEGSRVVLTVRDNTGAPLADAYVVIGDGDPDVFAGSAPGDGDGSYARLGPVNQYSGPAIDPSAAYQACPLSLASGYTDANGRFEFQIDGNEVRRQIQFRQIVCQVGGGSCVQTLAWDTRISIHSAQLGYGVVENGVVVPYTIPAEFRPEPAGGGGRFANPASGQFYNTISDAWQPVVTLTPITPALTVIPYRRRGDINDPITGSPGGDDYAPMRRQVGGGQSWRTPGRFFDLGSADPQGCASDQICITGPTQGEFQVSYFHDTRVGGAVQSADVVSCSDGTFTCPATGANTTPMQIDPNQPVGPAACGNGVVRYFATMPSSPLVNARARSRIEVRSLFTPPGGSDGLVLNGKVNLQVGLDPIPAWFDGPSTRYANRSISQFPNGLASFSGIESLTGGGPSAVDASSNEFTEVNLDSPQENNTNSTRTFERWQLNAVTPAVYETNDVLSENTVSNNDGRDVSPDVDSLPSTDNLDVQTIIDTGKIPLFRFTYGAPPIASATLGADFWLNAAVRYGGAMTLDGDVPNFVYITEPFSEFGLDIFFDFSAVGGLVSASAEASASVYLSNRSEFRNGALDPSTFQCFGFNLDVTFEICALFCGSYTENLISVYKNRPDNQAGRSQCTTDTLSLPSFFPHDGTQLRLAAGGAPRVTLAPKAGTSLAYGQDGRGTMVYVDDQNRLMMRTIPFARYNDPLAVIVEGNADTITSTATASFDAGAGIALWSYVPGAPGSIESGTQQQHIRWARTTSNGAQFQPQDLTAPGAGDGNVVVGVCPPAYLACPAGGEATAVWVRRIGASWAAHHYALMYARYTPGSGWTTPARVDASQGQNSDLLPTVVYRRSTGTPVVFWVRKPTPGLESPEARRVAYRFLDGASPVRVANDLPSAVSWPSATWRIVRNGNLDVEELALAYTVNVDPVSIAGRPKAFVGNSNALHVARCSLGANGSCSFVDEQLRDRFGRNLRAEKPTLAADSGGELAVGFNGLGFGPDGNGNTNRITDPIGMLSGQGDLVIVRPKLDGSPVSVIDVDLGSIGAFKPSLAFNPALDRFDAVSQPLNVGTGVVAAASKKLGLRPLAKGAAGGLSPSVRFASMGAGPDLRIETAYSASSRLTPGGTVDVQASVRNLGRAVAPAIAGDLLLVATWDGPAGSDAVAASVPLPTMTTDEITTQTLSVPVPAGFAADETHALVLSVVAAPAIGETDGSDNVRSVIFGSMPVPVDLRLIREPGQPMVFLRWTLDDPTDDRVAGYRVMLVDDNGNRIPLGSTPVQGFADLSIAPGELRRYVVTSYSANGVESAESAIVSGNPAPATFGGGDALFVDGFELQP